MAMCVDLTLPRDSTAPRMARNAVTTLLDGAGAAPELLGDAQLVATELVTNAIRHACGLVRLHASFGEESVRIEVADESAESIPVRARAEGLAEGGHGMALIETLAVRWGITPVARGKVVWAELAR